MGAERIENNVVRAPANDGMLLESNGGSNTSIQKKTNDKTQYRNNVGKVSWGEFAKTGDATSAEAPSTATKADLLDTKNLSLGQRINYWLYDLTSHFPQHYNENSGLFTKAARWLFGPRVSEEESEKILDIPAEKRSWSQVNRTQAYYDHESRVGMVVKPIAGLGALGLAVTGVYYAGAAIVGAITAVPAITAGVVAAAILFGFWKLADGVH